MEKTQASLKCPYFPLLENAKRFENLGPCLHFLESFHGNFVMFQDFLLL